MIVYSQKSHTSKKQNIIALFGVGLIGNAICRDIERQGKYNKTVLPFNWEYGGQAKKDAIAICQTIRDITFADSEPSLINIAFVWSAGKAGFTASKSEIDKELNCYEVMLALVCNVIDICPRCNVSFHHFSSVGGLFEGQCSITQDTLPSPKRYYGLLKYEQEIKLKEIDLPMTKNIYRLTSVYGFINQSYRMGLIQTLLLNGIRNQVTTIYGSLSTLRDYVINDDIGRYVGRRLFSGGGDEYNIALLAASKPSSIYEIKHIVENVIGKKIYLQYRTNLLQGNDADITVGKAALPNDWSPIDIKLGINSIKEFMLLGDAFENKILE